MSNEIAQELRRVLEEHRKNRQQLPLDNPAPDQLQWSQDAQEATEHSNESSESA